MKARHFAPALALCLVVALAGPSAEAQHRGGGGGSRGGGGGWHGGGGSHGGGGGWHGGGRGGGYGYAVPRGGGGGWHGGGVAGARHPQGGTGYYGRYYGGHYGGYRGGYYGSYYRPYYYPDYRPYYYGGYWPYYGYDYWPYYGAAPYDRSLSVTWVEKQDFYWRYCVPLKAYYPYVKECPNDEWQLVEPRPAPGSDMPSKPGDAPG